VEGHVGSKRAVVLAETIERVLIGHIDTHRAQIEAKRRAIRE
jgi:demethoxyubiquinone hydroxylase (CLK1/Coq7/Cat5 family)